MSDPVSDWCTGRSRVLFERADKAAQAGDRHLAAALHMAADELRYAAGATHTDLASLPDQVQR